MTAIRLTSQCRTHHLGLHVLEQAEVRAIIKSRISLHVKIYSDGSILIMTGMNKQFLIISYVSFMLPMFLTFDRQSVDAIY